MNKNQKTAFWVLSIGFYIFFGMFMYFVGALEITKSNVGAGILILNFILVTYFINLYIRKNPDEIDSWFQ